MSSFEQLSCYSCGNPVDNQPCRYCTSERCGYYNRGVPCLGCNSETKNSFTYEPTSYFFNDTPNSFTHPPQHQYETYLCELCGNDSHYGYDYPPRFPFVYEQEPCYNQNFSDTYYPHNSPSLLCREKCEGSHESFQCQPMNQIFYNFNSSGFDQFQPSQYPVVHQPPQETSTEILQAREDLIEAIEVFFEELILLLLIHLNLLILMTSFDYRLNPFYPIKECSSCGALYTTDYCCSDGSLKDNVICDLNKTPDLFQEPPQNCPKCENPVDGQYCQGCALLRKKFKEDLFTYCIENGNFQDYQDTSEPSNDNTNIFNALQEPFIVKQDPGKIPHKVLDAALHQDQPSFNQNYMQQPIPNLKDITDPTTAMNMALALMAKAFKLNYSTPTNNNQRISSNLRNRQIAQPRMNMGQDRQMHMVGGNGGNQFRQYARVECRKSEWKEEAGIHLQAEEFDLMAAAVDFDKIKEVNANCILMANLQQASTSGTQTDKASVYDLDGSAEEIPNLNKQLSMEKSTVSSLFEENKKLKSDFKIREDELLDKKIQLEKRKKELDNILVKTGQIDSNDSHAFT
nr:hypothetical protein [Tanacetum cinerariifolium]